MRGWAALYLRLVGARIRAQLQYRVSFVLYVTGAFFLSFTDFLAVLVIFAHLPRLGGWSLGEVAFLYGTSYVTFKITDMAIGHLDHLPEQILQGEFDVVMTRPLGALFQTFTSDFQFRHVGGIAQGLVVLGVALSLVHISWTVGRALMLLVMAISGTVIFSSIWIVGATTAFWSVRANEYVNAFTYGGNQLTSYPIDIYAGWLRRLFAFVIPLAFVNYFPALYVLGRPDPLGAPAALRFASPLVAVTAALVARSAWGFGVRHYRSTGS